MEVTVTEIVRDEGSVVLFRGLTDDDTAVVFAVDHRMAGDIIEALINGDGDESVGVIIEAWQIVGAAA